LGRLVVGLGCAWRLGWGTDVWGVEGDEEGGERKE